MRRSVFPLVPLALVLAAPVAPAQDINELCRSVQNRTVTVGRWASYVWTGGRTDGATMRMAIVGTETQQGATYYWYETTLNDPKHRDKGKTIIQMLVPGLAYQMGGVRGMVMKTGSEPAMRMPDQMVRMMGSRVAPNIAAEITRGCQEMEVVGWEEVSVPAGSYRALHIRSAKEGTEAWVRPELFFVVVKVVTKDGAAMALTGSGRDAKSSITEQPRE